MIFTRNKHKYLSIILLNAYLINKGYNNLDGVLDWASNDFL